ncbi:hypothetical protein P5673_003252 [Acropora cervicornis]|uniref:Uncharacterized protein n=1 Tax=Acropora cervicornis TaxID=6130 RepID=A0AAD9VET2_ACRCE|nr:hypothetical protein P5673_003252 [Acropora cervicornis]
MWFQEGTTWWEPSASTKMAKRIVSGNLRSANLVESLEEGMVEVLPIPTPHGSLLKEGQLGINEMLTGEGKHFGFSRKM